MTTSNEIMSTEDSLKACQQGKKGCEELIKWIKSHYNAETAGNYSISLTMRIKEYDRLIKNLKAKLKRES